MNCSKRMKKQLSWCFFKTVTTRCLGYRFGHGERAERDIDNEGSIELRMSCGFKTKQKEDTFRSSLPRNIRKPR